MVKRREPQTSAEKQEPTKEQIENFAAGADGNKIVPVEKTLDKNAPRKFKNISLPFNEHEYEELLKGVNLSGRTKLNFVRYAMLKLSKELQEEANK